MDGDEINSGALLPETLSARGLLRNRHNGNAAGVRPRAQPTTATDYLATDPAGRVYIRTKTSIASVPADGEELR